MKRTLAMLLLACLATTRADSAAPAGAEAVPHDFERWQYAQEIPLPEAPAGDVPQYCDFVLPVSVFDQGREDLGDLRLLDAAGVEIPYALRVRRNENSEQSVNTRQFNRADGPNQSSELTLDLHEEPPEHNELEVDMPGKNYRRAAHLEGSADGQTWSKLLEKNLVDFQFGNQHLKDVRLVYPPSRYRYLRLRVERDPQVDEKAVPLNDVIVRRLVEIPGEFVTFAVQVTPREPVRAGAGPGSAWQFDLGGAKVPCEKLLVEIADPEFARDYSVEKAGIIDSAEPFQPVSSGQWSRLAGQPRRPLEADFSEQRAARLKLIVTDFRNPPLEVTGAQVVAPARQIVFERKATLRGPLRLFFGNPLAEPPHYDLERNLAKQLDPKPVRLTLSARETNPSFVPQPKPLSERWPWAIYVVLSGASLFLAVVLANLGRTAVALHDKNANTKPPDENGPEGRS